ncbi:BTAD domain-containing putative transcriptional regulator [Pengzhenrongella sicca]|uniref:Winged helix-turn-helix domain-containing protein n=1 Tax=Pengzhenrongella sicca TaxID=2819238 RepID=A0A8A4ZG88_9MICO|nr:BTAD domain-containing putative transcriptional regulator [Pengzhenrongella sicca]QTE30914.1 winged helix-turn-helix domain-containing protein [Pengzhenrongella sicca]
MDGNGGAPLLRVEVLGPLRVVVDGVAVDVPGPKRRAVLALLALAEARTVSADSLVDGLWPVEPPDAARQALHSHVSRLRGHLGPASGALQTQRAGYRLDVDAAGLDLAQARALLAAARAHGAGDPAHALPLLRQADGLWRGPVLADLTDLEPIGAAVTEIARLRRQVEDALIAAAVGAGHADEVLGLAADAVAADPFREPGVLLLMRALAGSGQVAEALRAAREFRQRLAAETGLDPSSALGDAERAVAGGTAGAGLARPGAGGAAADGTRLIGRAAQVAALHRVLATERLVTVTGPGGVGKTRVALEVARRSTTATVLLLAPVTDPAAVPHALAAALNLRVARGDVLAACVAVLGDQARLLVVDNCEHLLDAARGVISAVLAGCPEVTVLVTSRERLGLAAEYAFRLSPLALPGPDQDAAQAPSVTLFLERASRVRRGREPTATQLRTVADIVRRLDGIPLAIELAAGRLSTFSLEDLRDRLDRALDLLGGGAPSGEPRHRTLRATIEWSYDLLAEPERLVFRHLSVFVDGVPLETAERVAAELAPGLDSGSVLARLVDASMLTAVFGPDGTRYRMLETLRSFGTDRLAAAGESAAAADRFVRWGVALASWIGAGLASEREPEADAVLRRELANLRAVWQLIRRREAFDDAAVLVTALINAIAYRDVVELRAWAQELADDPALDRSPHAAAVLGTAAEAAYQGGDHRRAARLARAGLERGPAAESAWFCLLPLAVAELADTAYADVVEHALAAAAQPGPSRESFGIAALARAQAGDLEDARALNARGHADAGSPTLRSWGEYVAGEIENRARRAELAEQHYLRAIDLAQTSGATFLVGIATVGLLTVRVAAGRVGDALHGYRDVVDYFARTGNWTHLWVTLRNLADLLRQLGDDETADQLDAAAAGAPDAPARAQRAGRPVPAAGAGDSQRVLGRDAVLRIARLGIDRCLAN